MSNNTVNDYIAEMEREMVFIDWPLFSRKSGDDFDRQLVVNLKPPSGLGGWSILADGYKEAADTIVKALVSRHGWNLYIMACPVAFLYRHYLELRLKELLQKSSMFLDDPENAPKVHDLMTLWRNVRPNLERISDTVRNKNHLDEIEKRLIELAEIDPGSFPFRYPDDSIKDDHPNPGVFNINRLHNKLSKRSRTS